MNLNAKSLDIIIILEILIRPIFFGITALSSLQDTTTHQEMILSVRNWPKSIQFYCSFSWQDPNLVLWVVFHEYAWFVCCAYKNVVSQGVWKYSGQRQGMIPKSTVNQSSSFSFSFEKDIHEIVCIFASFELRLHWSRSLFMFYINWHLFNN